MNPVHATEQQLFDWSQKVLPHKTQIHRTLSTSRRLDYSAWEHFSCALFRFHVVPVLQIQAFGLLRRGQRGHGQRSCAALGRALGGNDCFVHVQWGSGCRCRAPLGGIDASNMERQQHVRNIALVHRLLLQIESRSFKNGIKEGDLLDIAWPFSSHFALQVPILLQFSEPLAAKLQMLRW